MRREKAKKKASVQFTCSLILVCRVQMMIVSVNSEVSILPSAKKNSIIFLHLFKAQTYT